MDMRLRSMRARAVTLTNALSMRDARRTEVLALGDHAVEL
jgi:hypothetical protein